MERTDQPTPQHSPTRSSQAHTWLSPDLYAELARIRAPLRPELRSLHDPQDYLAPHRLTFSL